jgi:hypothetical protein
LTPANPSWALGWATSPTSSKTLVRTLPAKRPSWQWSISTAPITSTSKSSASRPRAARLTSLGSTRLKL